MAHIKSTNDMLGLLVRAKKVARVLNRVQTWPREKCAWRKKSWGGI